MTTLQSATLDLAKKLTDVVESVATGGTTTTLVDSGLIYLRQFLNDDHYKGGTIWFRSGNNDGYSAVVKSYDATTVPGTITFDAITGGGACAADDDYSLCSGVYPRDVLRNAINIALRRMPIKALEDTSLTTVGDQRAYTVPTGKEDIISVEIATTQSAPYDYVDWYDWDVINGELVFGDGAIPGDSGFTIRLTYLNVVSAISDETDSIDGLYHPEWLAWEAAIEASQWRIGLTDGKDAHAVGVHNQAVGLARGYEEEFKKRIPEIQRQVKLPRFYGV